MSDPILDKLDEVVRLYPQGISTEDDLLVFYCKMKELLAEVAIEIHMESWGEDDNEERLATERFRKRFGLAPSSEAEKI